MPRAASQKHIHASASAGHPYAVATDANSSATAPTSSASAAHSPHSQQNHLNHPHSLPHMNSLPPPSGQFAQQEQESNHYRAEDAGSSSNQTSPRDTPHLQAQSLSGRSEGNQGNQQQRTTQDGMTKMTNNSSSSTESSRAPAKANLSPSSASASASGSSSTPVKAAGTAVKKKHVCPTCDRAFTTSGHLARHARVHTGERNHKCPFPGCETRCSRQDNLQQHYRIHLSPGSRRSSSSATRAAIRGAISNPATTPGAVGTTSDLDAPPPLAQATFPVTHLAQPHVQYTPVPQPYSVPPQPAIIQQAHVPSPHVPQQSYHPHTPPVPSGTGHIYENGNGSGLAADVSRGYGHGQPESPGDHSGPGSATPSADASPVIGGPGSGSQYAPQQQTYIYVQHSGYYQASQHPSPSPQVPAPSSTAYTTPSPSSNLDGQYQAPPQISTFYQQHHYPREAYIASTATASPPTQTPPNYSAQHPLPQQSHDQVYMEPTKAKKRRGRPSGGSMVNGEQSPSDSPVTTNTQGQPNNNRTNGQGQSNVYAFYGMAAPSSAPPPSSGSNATAPPPPSASSHGNTRYAVTNNGSGFGQFQLHTPPPPPPPLTTSSAVTTSSGISYSSNLASYPQNANVSNAGAGNGTHSPPPVLAPIQTKRPSYHDSLPSRYSYTQHPNHANYASVAKGYSE